MARSRRQEDFLRFRDQFPVLIFENQEYDLSSRGLEIRYTFNLSDRHYFHPRISIPWNACFRQPEALASGLDNIVFNLGMIELISYWKCACPPRVMVRPFTLDAEQVAWWKKLFYNGLGEFFYLNSIQVTETDFMELAGTPGSPSMIPGSFFLDDSVIVPVGGGKDSAVTLELLGSLPGTVPLIMNPRGASLQTASARGYSADQIITVRRTIDPALLKLNEQGFLNGHTPFSALLAFVTVLAGIVAGHRHIALSNESSANEVTIEGTHVNHQYSKSLQFESDFRQYVRKWVCPEINYFSFLRPLSELQIASLFSRLTRYHPVFKSCNAGSRADSWCGVCAKCLFTWCILAPFMKEAELEEIFGRNLFKDKSLRPLLDQLTGVADEKPFDCVGTVSEVNMALCETIRQRDGGELPFLLDHYKKSPAYYGCRHADFRAALRHLSAEHHLRPEFVTILESELEKVNSATG